MSLYHYLTSWLAQEEEVEADEKSKHQKHLVCNQIKQSKIRLKSTDTKPKKPVWMLKKIIKPSKH